MEYSSLITNLLTDYLGHEWVFSRLFWKILRSILKNVPDKRNELSGLLKNLLGKTQKSVRTISGKNSGAFLKIVRRSSEISKLIWL